MRQRDGDRCALDETLYSPPIPYGISKAARLEASAARAPSLARSPFVIAGSIGACVGLLISAVLGVRQLAQEQAEAAFQPTVDVVTLAPGAIRSELVYAGVVQAPQQATVTSLSAGTLTSMTANVGDSVRSGDRLASITTESLPAQLRQAQADLVAAESRRALLGAGARSTDVDSARAVLTAAEAKLAQLLQPSATDVAIARSALATAQSSLASNEVAIETSRALLLGAIGNACNLPPGQGIPVPCNGTDIPLPAATSDAIAGFLQSRSGDTRSDLGQRAVAVLQTNGNYRGALAGAEAAKQAVASASAKLDALLNPSASDIAAQRAQVQVARDSLENKANPYTDADIQAANATVARAAAQIAQMEASLARTSITAPFDGVVAQRLVEPGANVTTSTPLFVLVAKGAQVQVTLRDTDAANIKPGAAVEVTTPEATKPLTGRVLTIAPIGDPRAHTVEVHISADSPATALRPGTFTQVRILTSQKSDALAVPNDSIVPTDQGPRVFVVRDGKARALDVTLGIVGRTSTEITKGLAAGDVVIVEGHSTLRDGQAVKVAGK